MEIFIPCFVNYTFFPHLYYQQPNYTFVRDIKNVNNCLDICLTNEQCTGFNYEKFQSLCYFYENLFYNSN